MLKCPECNSQKLSPAGFVYYRRRFKKPLTEKHQRYRCAECWRTTVVPRGKL